MITVTKFAVNCGTPDDGCWDFGGALLPVPGASRDMIDWGPVEVAGASRDVIGWGPDDDTAATLHKSVRQQLNEQFGADLFICAQAAKWNKTFAMIA